MKPTPKEDVLFIIGDWNAKVGSQENFLLGVTGKFGLGVQNEAGQRLIEFAKRMHWSYHTPSSNNTREDSTHGHEILSRDFPGGPVAKTLCSQSRGPGFNP